MELSVESFSGADIARFAHELAGLRIQVFREWPYLYEGSLAYEESYLRPLFSSQRSLCLTVRHQGQLVGASTGLPLLEADPEFIQPFRSSPDPLHQLFYFGESVLLEPFRGRGLGRQFFELREQHAARLGFEQVAFCAVVRPQQHPLRPPRVRSLEPFWNSLGYQPLPGIQASYSWKDLDQVQETSHPMQFWGKLLSL
jgi:GNAT superfamily N-acetyltransferase